MSLTIPATNEARTIDYDPPILRQKFQCPNRFISICCLKEENRIEVYERLSVAAKLPIEKEIVGRTKVGEVTEKKTAPSQQYDAPSSTECEYPTL